jgi:hypothetical protein
MKCNQGVVELTDQYMPQPDESFACLLSDQNRIFRWFRLIPAEAA